MVLYGECSVVVAAFNNSSAWAIIQYIAVYSLANRDESIDGIGVLVEGIKCIGIG